MKIPLNTILVTALCSTSGLAQEREPSEPLARLTLVWPADATEPQPVCVDLPAALPGNAHWEIRCQVSANALPAQRDPVNPKQLWWVATPSDKATEMPIEIYAVQRTDIPAAVAEKGLHSLSLRMVGRPVLDYRYTPMPPPEGRSSRYTRAGFIHPLFSPQGEILTAIHPSDHIHHMGIWNPWTCTEFEGREVDFWNVNKGQGTVRFKRFDAIVSGPVFAGFRARHEHVDLTAPAGETVVLDEVWDVRVWNWQEDSFLIDMVITQTCVADVPLTLKAHRYGGLGFRGRLGWHASNSDYLTSEGRTRRDGHASRARWCHAFGDTPKGGAGVLFMSHPDNREHPEPMRLWPPGANRGKNNLFFNFCPVQKRPWTLEPGMSYTLRYRLNVYSGKPSTQYADSLWKALARPPVIRSMNVPGSRP